MTFSFYTIIWTLSLILALLIILPNNFTFAQEDYNDYVQMTKEDFEFGPANPKKIVKLTPSGENKIEQNKKIIIPDDIEVTRG